MSESTTANVGTPAFQSVSVIDKKTGSPVDVATQLDANAAAASTASASATAASAAATSAQTAATSASSQASAAQSTATQAASTAAAAQTTANAALTPRSDLTNSPVLFNGTSTNLGTALASAAASGSGGGGGDAYVLPIASTTRLGGIKAGSGLTIAADGTASVSGSSALPVATTTTLGAVKGGGNVTIAADGTLNATTSGTLTPATATTLGGVKVGSGLSVAADGTLSTSGGSTIPIASTTQLGGIKQGAGLAIAADGTASTTGTPVQSVSASGATTLKIPTSGNITYYVTPTAAATLQFSGAAVSGQSQSIRIIVLGAGFTVTLPTTGVFYPDGTAPTVSTATGDLTVVDYLAASGAPAIVGGV